MTPPNPNPNPMPKPKCGQGLHHAAWSHRSAIRFSRQSISIPCFPTFNSQLPGRHLVRQARNAALKFFPSGLARKCTTLLAPHPLMRFKSLAWMAVLFVSVPRTRGGQKMHYAACTPSPNAFQIARLDGCAIRFRVKPYASHYPWLPLLPSGFGQKLAHAACTPSPNAFQIARLDGCAIRFRVKPYASPYPWLPYCYREWPGNAPCCLLSLDPHS